MHAQKIKNNIQPTNLFLPKLYVPFYSAEIEQEADGCRITNKYTVDDYTVFLLFSWNMSYHYFETN